MCILYIYNIIRFKKFIYIIYIYSYIYIYIYIYIHIYDLKQFILDEIKTKNNFILYGMYNIIYIYYITHA